MLALQVAAGIVLAYVIIVNQRKLLAFGKGAVAMAITAGVGAIIVWAIMSGYQAAHDQWVSTAPLPAWISKLLDFLFLIPAFLLFAFASIGLLMLIGLGMRKTPAETWRSVSVAMNDGDEEAKDDEKGCLGLMFGIGLLMFVVNYALSWPVFAVTPLGTWGDELYRYGMQNEWKDGLQILYYLMLCQWPWVPVGIYYLVKRLRGRAEA